LKAYLFAIFSLLLILPVLFLTVWQVTAPKVRYEIRKEAATPTGTATLSFVPASATVFATQRLPISIEVYTPTTPENKGITGITAIFSYNNAGALELTESDITTPLPAPWQYVIKEITTVGSTTTVAIEAVYAQAGTTGYLGAVASPQIFATLNFFAKDTGVTTTVVTSTFDIDWSVIMSKAPFNATIDILSSNLASGSYTVYVDNFPPETTITSGPTAPLRTAQATFEYTGDDNPPIGSQPEDLVYSYRLDSGSWSTYSSNTSVTLTTFSAGSHTFYVRAKDIVGNVDPSPASWSFTYEPQTNLDLKLMFDDLPAVCTPDCQNYDKPVQVTIKNASYDSGALSGTATFDAANSYYSVVMELPADFPAGSNSYQILVKGRSYLQKNLGNITLTKDTDNLVNRASSAYKLIVGDTTGDNYIMLNDVTSIISVWIESETPVTTETEKYDLVENGYIALSDITAVIANWTTSRVPGDE
ncbi:hypothetical protein AMJ51_02225, partial [Microgenomates bacterium DG_75]